MLHELTHSPNSVAIAVADPSLGDYLAQKTWCGSQRRKFECPGKRKRAINLDVQAELEAKELALFGPVTHVSSSSEAGTSHKRRRITSDRAMVIAAPEVATDSRTRASRTCS